MPWPAIPVGLLSALLPPLAVREELLRLLPPLVISREEIGRVTAALDYVLQQQAA